jgi:hypothetical protein
MVPGFQCFKLDIIAQILCLGDNFNAFQSAPRGETRFRARFPMPLPSP